MVWHRDELDPAQAVNDDFVALKLDPARSHGDTPWPPLATNSMDTRENLRYRIPYKNEEVWPPKQWQWQRDRVLSALANDKLAFIGEPGHWTVDYKQYLRDEDGKERGSTPYSALEGLYTPAGTGEIRDIFGAGKVLSLPKPSGLIAHLVSFAPKDCTVLDFFAGSGTTAHAVARLNAEDGGTHLSILVRSTGATADEPAKNLCHDVCAMRVRGVMGGLYQPKYEALAGLGGGFVYLHSRQRPRHRLSPGSATSKPGTPRGSTAGAGAASSTRAATWRRRRGSSGVRHCRAQSHLTPCRRGAG